MIIIMDPIFIRIILPSIFLAFFCFPKTLTQQKTRHSDGVQIESNNDLDKLRGFGSNENKTKSSKTVRIAIIGGGVGGTSAAYFINELLSKKTDLHYEIIIYEKNYRLGGRLHTVTMGNKQYEAGGSIIHERNKYVSELADKFGLKKKSIEAGNRLCIYNGEKFVFCESSWEIITLIKLIRYYGFDLIRLQKQVSKMIDHFEKIYELQNQQYAYEQLSELLSALDSLIYNLTKTTYRDLLQSQYKLSKEFIYEIAQAISLGNYGQTTLIPALVGLISFAVSDSQLFAIEGGNKLLPLHLAHFSQARIFLNTQVISVNYLGDHQFRIHSKRLDASSQEPSLRSDIYDYVIIATPLASENNLIRFNNLTKRNELINDIFEKYHMHRTVVTFVTGQVLNKYKDLSVLSCDIDRDEGGSFFISLSKLSPVINENRQKSSSNDKNKNVHKIFSNRKLYPHELYSLFEDIEDIQEISWLAYPEYKSTIQPLPPFRLRAGVYYLNAIEWAASSIEMSLIGGKNVALLVCRDLNVCQDQNSKHNLTTISTGTNSVKRKIEL